MEGQICFRIFRTHGKTYEEAVRQGRDAIASWIDDARASGDPIPPPKMVVRV